MKKNLYLSRKVINSEEIVTWAKSQGFKSLLNPKEMHVTIVYSKEPIDWNDLGESYKTITVKKPNTREIHLFDGGAVVLTLENSDLTNRWQEAIDLGASWSYDDYTPHVTLTYEGADGVDISKIEPFKGNIILGEEIFEKLNSNWKSGSKEFDVNENEKNLPHIYWISSSGDIIECENHSEYILKNWRDVGLLLKDIINFPENLSEIEEEELCDLALEKGWIMGSGEKLHASSLKFLKKGSEVFNKKWPDANSKLCLRHRWEKTFTPENITEFVETGFLPENEEPNFPKKFWLVTNIPSSDDYRYANIVKDISDLTLRGVKGISDTRRIISQRLHSVGNAAIIMDAAAVLKHNQIQRIEYNNIPSLLKDNMSTLRRILNKSHDRLGNQGLLYVVSQYMIRHMKQMDYNIWHLMEYYGYSSRIGSEYASDEVEISTLDDLVRWVVSATKKISSSDNHFRSHLKQEFEGLLPEDERFRKCLKEALIDIGRMYSDEGEWIVLSKEFSVPHNSTLLLLIDSRAKEAYAEWKENPNQMKFATLSYALQAYDNIMHTIEKYDLMSKYDIRVVDSMKYATIINGMKARKNESN